MDLWITVNSYRIIQVWFSTKRGYHCISWVSVGMLMFKLLTWLLFLVWFCFVLFGNILSLMNASSYDIFCCWIQQKLPLAIPLWSCVIFNHSCSSSLLPIQFLTFPFLFYFVRCYKIFKLFRNSVGQVLKYWGISAWWFSKAYYNLLVVSLCIGSGVLPSVACVSACCWKESYLEVIHLSIWETSLWC